MKNLTVTLCLTIAVLLGSAGVSWSADFQKGLTAAQSGDFATALREWTPLAEQGNADAQSNLGQMYDQGLGVSQDYKTAVKWYTLAAEQGNADAQFTLGMMNDHEEEDYKTALKWYTLAAEQGDARAQNNLGSMYRYRQGVPQDYKTAMKWYRLAAEQGDVDAKSSLTVLAKRLSVDNKVITKKKIFNTDLSFEITKTPIEENYMGKTINFFRNGKIVLSKGDSYISANISDINDDQREEVLVGMSDGGNCCAPDLYLYFVDTQTNELKEVRFDEWQAWQGWDDVRITTLDNIATLTNTVNYDGHNPNLARSDFSYEFDGSKVRLPTIKKYTKTPALVELKSTDFDQSNKLDEVQNLKFDLDSDGEDEEFSCGYWGRWGVLIGCTIISNKYGNVLKFAPHNEPLGKRLGVLSEKKNGWHILVVDFNERWIFHSKVNQYRKEGNDFQKGVE